MQSVTKVMGQIFMNAVWQHGASTLQSSLNFWNIDNTATLNVTQSIHCVPRTCEVNSSVLVDCIMKNRHTGKSGNFVPSNFTSDSTKMQQKCMTS